MCQFPHWKTSIKIKNIKLECKRWKSHDKNACTKATKDFFIYHPALTGFQLMASSGGNTKKYLLKKHTQTLFLLLVPKEKKKQCEFGFKPI